MKHVDIVIPDIHGDEYLVDQAFLRLKINPSIRKAIFLGNIWDLTEENYDTQERIFRKIVSLKEKYPDKIEWLLGKHDVHYMTGRVVYTGYNHEHCNEIRNLLKKYEYLFQNCYVCPYTKTLYTNSGLSHVYFNYLHGVQKKSPDVSFQNWLNGFSIEDAHTISRNAGFDKLNNLSFIQYSSFAQDVYLGEDVEQQVIGNSLVDLSRFHKDFTCIAKGKIFETCYEETDKDSFY